MADEFDWPGHLQTQFQGLLDDIRAFPEELALRLILADWLEEFAEMLPDAHECASASDWATLLRLQTERETSRGRITIAEREILDRNSHRWLGKLPICDVEIEWRGGFLALAGGVFYLLGAIRHCDEAVFTRALWLRPTGSGQGRSKHLESLLGLPQLSGIGVLELGMTNLGENAARALARSPHLSALRHLVARNVGFGSVEFAHLAGSPYLRPECLDLGYNAAGDEGVIALAESPVCSRLRTLQLQRVNLGDDAALALLESPHLVNLRELSLYGNRDLSQALARRLEERWGMGFSW